MTPTAIVWDVAQKHGLTVREVLSKGRRETVVAARCEAAYRLFFETDLRLMDIATILDCTNHTSIVYLRDKYALRVPA